MSDLGGRRDGESRVVCHCFMPMAEGSTYACLTSNALGMLYDQSVSERSQGFVISIGYHMQLTFVNSMAPHLPMCPTSHPNRNPTRRAVNGFCYDPALAVHGLLGISR